MTEDNETTTTAVAVNPPGYGQGIVLTPPTRMMNMDELTVMKVIAQTAITARGQAVPKDLDTPGKAMAIMMAGYELGFMPMTSLRHIFAINGRTEPDAQAMAALVLQGDRTARFIWHEYSQDACDVELVRAGRAPVRVRYTREDAEKSGQLKKGGPWQSYTRDMLAYSSMKRCCRLGAPELVNLPTISVREAGRIVESLGPVEIPDGPRVELGPGVELNEGDTSMPDYGEAEAGESWEDNGALEGDPGPVPGEDEPEPESEARATAREVRQGAARSYPSPAHAALMAELDDYAQLAGEPAVTDWLATVGVVVERSIVEQVAKLTEGQAVRVGQLLADYRGQPAQERLV